MDESADPGALFERMAALERAGTPFVAATVVEVSGSAPRHVGAKMLVFADGGTLGSVGGGGLEKRVTEEALEVLDAGASALRRYDLVPEEKGGIGSECGGRSSVFFEVRGVRPRLVVVGGGHIGLALARAAAPLGFALTIVDGREAFSAAERFPAGTRILRGDPSSPDTAARIPEGAFVVILTHSHALDREALRHVLARDPAYVGMIGSRRKVRVILDSLREAGVPAEDLARVFTPVGLDIGAETPEEIALSILAEIVHVRRKGGPSSASLREGKP